MASRWNARYARMDNTPTPAYVLTRYAHLLPTEGAALDLASGLGGNALFLADCGLSAHAWDISATAIAGLQIRASELKLRVTTEVRDVISQPPEPGSFAVIVVSRFLARPLFPALIAALCPGGVLFYQTFVVGCTDGPDNPDYLLTPGELLLRTEGLRIRAFEDSGRCGRQEQGLRQESCIVAQKLL